VLGDSSASGVSTMESPPSLLVSSSSKKKFCFVGDTVGRLVVSFGGTVIEFVVVGDTVGLVMSFGGTVIEFVVVGDIVGLVVFGGIVVEFIVVGDIVGLVVFGGIVVEFIVVGDIVGLVVFGGIVVEFIVVGEIDGDDVRDDGGDEDRDDDGVLVEFDVEIDGTSDETAEGLFVIATLGFIDVEFIDATALGIALTEGKALGVADCASLGEVDAHATSSDWPKSTFKARLLVPILLPCSPAKATTASSNVTIYSAASNLQHSSALSADSTTKRYALSLGIHLDDFFSIGGVSGMTSSFWRYRPFM